MSGTPRHARRIAALAAFAVLGHAAPVPAQVPPTEGYAPAPDSVQLFYRVLGAGPDTVVVVHGGPGLTMDYFLEDLAPLAEHHAVVFYDQRGAGRSTLVADSAALAGERFADDLDAIRRHFGWSRINVLGHSWGVGVAALYAERYADNIGRLLLVGGVPARRSMLMDAFAEISAGRDSIAIRRLAELKQARLDDPADSGACRAYYEILYRPFWADPAAAARNRGDFCAGTPAARRNKLLNVDRFVWPSLGDWDWRDALRRVRAPTLVIHGTKDPMPLSGAREIAALIDGARILELQGIGHFPYVESPAAFFDAVTTFLRGGWPAGAVRPPRP